MGRSLVSCRLPSVVAGNIGRRHRSWRLMAFGNGTARHRASSAASATPTTPGTTSPTTKTPSTSTATTGGSPYVTNTGILGGVNNGLGPSGAGMNTDISHAGISLQNASLFSFITIIISALALI
uniref:Uncharacterized protein LOC104241185 n=1 Tax=Nicotiana sylvestris TaxID=4096 RepID=A0A1U7Y583_NICSY|nr:PREDICTED: uncharacterized protein LOC104241185 [Nicotiana sylvestris]